MTKPRQFVGALQTSSVMLVLVALVDIVDVSVVLVFVALMDVVNVARLIGVVLMLVTLVDIVHVGVMLVSITFVNIMHMAGSNHISPIKYSISPTLRLPCSPI